MKWDELNLSAKILIGIATGIVSLSAAAAVVDALVKTESEALADHNAIKVSQQVKVDALTAQLSRLKTDSASALAQLNTDVKSQFNQDRVDRANREITQIDYDLKFDKALTPEEKEFKRNRRQDLRDMINCINDKNCTPQNG